MVLWMLELARCIGHNDSSSSSGDGSGKADKGGADDDGDGGEGGDDRADGDASKKSAGPGWGEVVGTALLRQWIIMNGGEGGGGETGAGSFRLKSSEVDAAIAAKLTKIEPGVECKGCARCVSFPVSLSHLAISVIPISYSLEKLRAFIDFQLSTRRSQCCHRRRCR